MADVCKIGINGFGRTGRMVLRGSLEQGRDVVVVAINDPYLKPDYAAYQLKHDSVFGPCPGAISYDASHLIVNGRKIKVFNEFEPEKIGWGSTGAEYICESSGMFRTREDALKHITGGGAKKVVISAPGKGSVPQFVMGVNHNGYESCMDVVSNASCTTNCLAPMSKVLNDKFGVEEGLMTTVHAMTATQLVVDGASKGGKDWRSGRGAGQNIIPTSTGAAEAIGVVLPELKGKLTGMAFRVPVADVSVVDLTVRLQTPATYGEIMDAFRNAASSEMKGVMGVTDEAVVSSDFIHDPRTCVIDVKAGIAMSPFFVKIVAWYDNEFAYSSKLLDLMQHMHQADTA